MDLEGEFVEDVLVAEIRFLETRRGWSKRGFGF